MCQSLLPPSRWHFRPARACAAADVYVVIVHCALIPGEPRRPAHRARERRPFGPGQECARPDRTSIGAVSGVAGGRATTPARVFGFAQRRSLQRLGAQLAQLFLLDLGKTLLTGVPPARVLHLGAVQLVSLDFLALLLLSQLSCFRRQVAQVVIVGILALLLLSQLSCFRQQVDQVVIVGAHWQACHL